VGVFGAVKAFPGDAEFEEDMALLQIVGSTLSQAVKIYRGAAQERAKLLQENRLLREELGTRYRFDNIVGSSPAMQRVFSIITNVAPARSTVLIRGESGTGKELIAHAIHFNSPRASRPFVRVNCAAIPENLLEAELFGHVKGSFTGALADRKGKFVLADGGTIFLDEIGDMSPLLQAKILRVLQEREVEAVGSEQVVKVDVRVLAATHQNLEALIEEKKFREDLYYRLNVVPIHVPPLRERLEDVKVLAEHFLAKFQKENGVPDVRFSADALRALLRYHWPGNVRELENVIERAVVLCDGKTIQVSDLPGLAGQAPVPHEPQAGAPGSLGEAVEQYLDGKFGPAPADGEIWDRAMGVVEDVLIRRAIERAGGVRLRAADILGIHRNTLRKKLGG
jgi:Nif-specific regulatory protein